MGIPGLWDILNKAGKSRALANLAVIEGFEGNKSAKRAYRVGIDASIWYHHTHCSKGGENPEVRTLFFRLKSLAELPILPLFVFDGSERPKIKRDSRLGKSGSHVLAQDMRTLLNAFGMEWRTARGEAEAELAHLNQKGHIDAILTDDCDALIFGGRTLIKNSSLSLAGNKSNPAVDASGKASKHHVMIYTIDAIQNHPEVGLSRGGLVLIALLCGGDYHKGVERFGKVIAHALARCGFGDQLLKAYEGRNTRDIDLDDFLSQWRTTINMELRTNTRGFLPHKSSLSLPGNFPDLHILDKYAYPVDSKRAGTSGGGAMRDKGVLDLKRLAEFCEEKFEWGYRSAIIKRFTSLMWKAAVIHVIRHAALMADERERTRRIESGIRDSVIRGPLRPSRVEAVCTPSSLVKQHLGTDNSSKRSEDQYADAFANRGRQPQPAIAQDTPDPYPLITKVVGTRFHISTDYILEYRVEVSPVQLVSLVLAGIKGKRAEPRTASAGSLEYEFNDVPDGDTSKNGAKEPLHPESPVRIWVPGSMLHQVHPGLIEDYVMEVEARKTNKRTRNGKMRIDGDGDYDSDVQSSLSQQVRSRRTEVGNPVARDLACQNNSANLEPWFTSGGDNVVGCLHSVSMKSGFLFTFPDPESSIEDKDAPHVDSHDTVLLGHFVQEDDLPSSRFEALFDQVMGLSKQPSRSSKASDQKKRRRNVVSNALTKLDKLEDQNDGRSTKRQKMAQAAVSPSFQPFPMMPALSDSEDAASNSSALPIAKAFKGSTSLRWAALQPHTYPEPSSSQESRLSSRSDDFIDLT